MNIDQIGPGVPKLHIALTKKLTLIDDPSKSVIPPHLVILLEHRSLEMRFKSIPVGKTRIKKRYSLQFKGSSLSFFLFSSFQTYLHRKALALRGAEELHEIETGSSVRFSKLPTQQIRHHRYKF